ncbi:MAG: hypothetical protein HKO62_04865 [Gammaproteobacteria bacterium]|nr:hypothetical protein [Gammaproteobacteria bacterium]NNM00061.1 hypothetical protein [Gammaproteobacteria bacterium]
MTRYLYSSVTRISALAGQRFEMQPLARSEWASGDYVVGEVRDASGLHSIELPNGRMMEAMEGDLVVGAFGARAATLEAVGNWQSIDGEIFDGLTPAGLFGKLTSSSPFLPKLMTLRYRGHVQRAGVKQTMDDARPAPPAMEFAAPMVLITGTSMSSGKTMSGRTIIHLLSQAGLKVVGAKLTGAARYRDVLSYEDAGADRVFDFVDVGLPSTVVDPGVFAQRCADLLSLIAAAEPDVVVAEAGASPLEPYNGDTAIELLGDRVRFNLLCASDPYAVMGVASAFQRQPDLVAGGAANTTAGIALVRELTGLAAMNLLHKDNHAALTALLLDRLGLRGA